MKTITKACGAVLHTRSQAAGALRHCLASSLNGIRFGIDTRMINQIARYGILAELVDKPACVRGFLRCDGVMIPVLDIAVRYGNRPLAPGRRTCLVRAGLVMASGGVMVDEVLGVAELKPGDVSPVPESGTKW